MKTKLTILIVLCLCLSVSTNAQNKQKLMKSFLGKDKKDTSRLPDVYTFQWEYKTIMKTSKNEEMNMDYLINPNSDYFGMKMPGKESRQMDFMCIVVDSKIETSITFMSSGGQKMAMLSKQPQEGT